MKKTWNKVMDKGEKGYLYALNAIKDYYMPVPKDKDDKKRYRSSRSTIIAYNLFLVLFFFIYPYVHHAFLEANPTQGIVVLVTLNVLAIIFSCLFGIYLYQLYKRKAWFKSYQWMTIVSLVIIVITCLRSLYLLF